MSGFYPSFSGVEENRLEASLTMAASPPNLISTEEK